MSDTKTIIIPSLSLNYEDNLLESIGMGRELYYRKQRDWKAIARSHEQTIERMGAEIAKLRELVNDLFVMCTSDCLDCEHGYDDGSCRLYDRMRELGIEVDE